MQRTYFLSITSLIALVGLSVWQTDVWHSELADHPDEAAHFITGVMVHDYLANGLGSAPVQFALDYYVHYPKIAIGHWPPAFYAIEGALFLVTGPSIKAAIALVIGCLLGNTLLVYHTLRNRYDNLTAFWCAAMPLALPVVRRTGTMLLTDTVVTLFSLLAILAFAAYLKSGRLRDMLVFSFWAVAAILTKGTGLALVLFVPLAILLAGRFSILRSWQLWACSALIGLLTLPFYILQLGPMINVGGGSHLSHGYMLKNMTALPTEFVFVLGAAAAAMFVAGAVLTLVPRNGKGADDNQTDRVRVAKIAAANVFSVILFLAVTPIELEPRYLVAVVPSAFLVIAELFSWIRNRAVVWQVAFALAAALAIIIPHANSHGGHMSSRRITGYQAAIQNLPRSGDSTVILVSSLPDGEGAIVAACRLRDPAVHDYALRASKILATDSWSGANYQLIVTHDNLKQKLRDLCVHHVVVDDFLTYPGRVVGQHHSLLKEVIAASPQDFAKEEVVPVVVAGKPTVDMISVYEFVPTRGQQPGAAMQKELAKIARKASGRRETD